MIQTNQTILMLDESNFTQLPEVDVKIDLILIPETMKTRYKYMTEFKALREHIESKLPGVIIIFFPKPTL